MHRISISGPFWGQDRIVCCECAPGQSPSSSCFQFVHLRRAVELALCVAFPESETECQVGLPGSGQPTVRAKWRHGPGAKGQSEEAPHCGGIACKRARAVCSSPKSGRLSNPHRQRQKLAKPAKALETAMSMRSATSPIKLHLWVPEANLSMQHFNSQWRIRAIHNN